jgi:hypothetical protein
MSEDRQVRGNSVAGAGRLRGRVFVAIVALLGLTSASVASGASGGAGTSPGTSPGSGARTAGHGARGDPFTGRGMWIWELSSSSGGNLDAIVTQARQYGIKTVMIKSGDGSSTWAQFSPAIVATLHSAGLRVCAWQYVYGAHPVAEAQVGAAAIEDGADCLLIDAESEYQGRYVAAQKYVRTLRSLIGNSFPVALAGFPYVDFHPGFPYSVFLGPGGAQYNVPQMYWHDIGTTVDRVYAHTYEFNRVYGRPISPLGQIYDRPPARDIRRFRALSLSYGAPGVSWFDWQEGTAGAWSALAAPVGWLASYTPDTSLASLGPKAAGDLVVWAQEHLVSAGETLAIDGSYGPATQTAVMQFQTAHGLLATGVIDDSTWQALLRYRPIAVRWTRKRGALRAVAARANAGGTYVLPTPATASLPAKRDEIPGAGGAGQPPGQPTAPFHANVQPG